MKILVATIALNLKDFMLPCLNKELFGVECPGCGIQRSAALLLQGDFIGAFKMYPAIYSIIILFGFLILDQFFKIKYSNQIIITLMISSVLLILTNYFLKFL